jgi:multiple sugar transport system substrate-binding protein
MKRKISLIVISMLFITLVFSVYGNAKFKAQKTQVKTTKLKVVSQMFTDPLQQKYIKENIFPKFKQETGVDVELQVVANVNELYKSLEAQKNTNNWTTDVLIAHDSVTSTLVKEYGVAKAYNWKPQGHFISQFDDNFIVNGKRYFIPLQADVYLLIANKKALPYLNKLGYNINDLTWEQLAKWCKLIKENTGHPRYVFPALAGKFATYEFNAIQLSYGAKYVPVLNTPEAKKAFDLVASMKEAILPSSTTIDFPIAPLGSEEAWITVFHQGYLNTSYSQSPDKFVIAPVPKGNKGYRGTIAGGHGLGIAAGSHNQAAAKKFIQFMLRDDILYETMSETGPWIPSKKEVLDKLGTKPADMIMKMGLKTLTGKTRIDRVHSSEYQDYSLVKKIYESVFTDILIGRKIDQSYLDAKQAELQRLKI